MPVKVMVASLLVANDPYYEVVLFSFLLAVQCAASTCAANLLENLTALLQQRRKCAETGGFFLLQRNSESKNEKNIQKSRMSLELRQLE